MEKELEKELNFFIIIFHQNSIINDILSGSRYNNDKYVFSGFYSPKIFKALEGEYLNYLRNGKGKEYYINGNIKFEGEY